MTRKEKAARDGRADEWHEIAWTLSVKLGKLQCWGAESKLQDVMGCRPAPGDSMASLYQCLRYFWLTGKKDTDGQLRAELRDLRAELIGEPMEALGWWDMDSFWHRDQRDIIKTLAALDALISAKKRWEQDAPEEFRAAMTKREQAEAHNA